MKNSKKLLLVFLGVALVFGLFGFKKKEDKKEIKYDEGDLVFDYYRCSVGTPEDVEYHELTLEVGSEGIVYLHEYRGSRDEGTTTYHKVYSIPEDLLTELDLIVEKNKLAKWNENQGICLDGAVTAVRFRDDNGELVRVSTDNMPEDGEKILGEIGSVMSSYLMDENIVIQ